METGSGSAATQQVTKKLQDMDTDDQLEKHLRKSTIFFHKEDLYEDENLQDVWATNVEEVFKLHGLACTLNWDESMMTMAQTNASPSGIFFEQGLSALMPVATGLPTSMVEATVSGTAACGVAFVYPPKGMDRDGFEREYNDLMDKFNDGCELARELSCVVFYSAEHIITLADTGAATDAVGSLAWHCIHEGIPYDDAVTLVRDEYKERLAFMEMLRRDK